MKSRAPSFSKTGESRFDTGPRFQDLWSVVSGGPTLVQAPSAQGADSPAPEAISGPIGNTPSSIALTAGSLTYTQNFDTLALVGTGSSLPTDWFFLETGASANTTYNTGNGSGTGGDTYSFGATGSSDRALGELTSGSLSSRFGALFTNSTGVSIYQLDISYAAEQWRFGAVHTTIADKLDFQISFDATSLTTGTWTDVNALDLLPTITGGVVGALDGNAAANRTVISGIITNLDIPAGTNFWIRWVAVDASAGDDGLAVDDFSLTAHPIPTAVGDSAALAENATVSIAVLDNDSGNPKSVVSIGGTALSAGQSVILASGAKVTLNADGTVTYDPNHAFDYLTNPSGGESGAQDLTAFDAFSYALNGGSSAFVNLTVNGVAGPGDHLNGNLFDNAITGTSGNDFFDLSQGGNDTAMGLAGDDGYYFGAAYTSADVVNDSGGTNDQLALRGDYSGGVTPGTITGIEAIVVLPGFSYSLTTIDANVAAGGVLKVQATQLAAGQTLTFNGAAEHDGSFLVYGGQGNDNFTGGDGNDGFYFGPGGFNASDFVNGGPGANDQLALDGDYTLTLGGNVANVEVLVLLHGPSGTPNHFNITSGDVSAGAGQTKIVFGLQTDTGITFNGSGELDGAFRIYGGTGNDTLTGSHGNDWIFGSNGADSLTGGAGTDIFYYDDVAQSTVAAADTILDFATGDKIDVSNIDAVAGGADNAFTFLGSGAFTHHAGELRAVNQGGITWLVQGDTNGDGVADFQLTLITSDAHPIAAADFML